MTLDQSLSHLVEYLIPPLLHLLKVISLLFGFIFALPVLLFFLPLRVLLVIENRR